MVCWVPSSFFFLGGGAGGDNSQSRLQIDSSIIVRITYSFQEGRKPCHRGCLCQMCQIIADASNAFVTKMWKITECKQCYD